MWTEDSSRIAQIVSEDCAKPAGRRLLLRAGSTKVSVQCEGLDSSDRIDGEFLPLFFGTATFSSEHGWRHLQRGTDTSVAIKPDHAVDLGYQFLQALETVQTGEM